MSISCECVDRHTLMAESLPDRLQCPDLQIPRLFIARWLGKDDKWFQLGIQGLNLINEGRMEHLISMLSHKFLKCR
jgi:hypothetical protein